MQALLLSTPVCRAGIISARPTAARRLAARPAVSGGPIKRLAAPRGSTTAPGGGDFEWGVEATPHLNPPQVARKAVVVRAQAETNVDVEKVVKDLQDKVGGRRAPPGRHVRGASWGAWQRPARSL